MVFGLVALLLLAPTFLRSAIGPDESLYFLVAESWRAGHLPYTTVFQQARPSGSARPRR
jgi:hypothetical protein